MVTLREGLQMFSQGAGQLGEGLQKTAEYDRRKNSAEGIRNMSDTQFEGGEAGRKMAIAAAAGGKEDVAAKLLKEDKSPTSIDALMTNIIMGAASSDPAKRAAAVQFFERARPFLEAYKSWSKQVTNIYGTAGPGNFEQKPVELKSLLAGIPNPPKATNILGRDRNPNELAGERAQWRKEASDTLTKNIETSMKGFPEESKTAAYNLMLGNLEAGFYGDDLPTFVEENKGAKVDVPVVAQEYRKGELSNVTGQGKKFKVQPSEKTTFKVKAFPTTEEINKAYQDAGDNTNESKPSPNVISIEEAQKYFYPTK